MQKIIEFGIYLIALSLPLYLIKFHIFGIPITVLESIILFVFAAWLFKKFLIDKDWGWKKTNFDLPIILFLLAAIISTIVSPDKIKSLGILKAWIIEPVLVFYLIVNNIQIKKQFLYLISSLGFSAAVLSLYGIFQYIIGQTTGDDRILSVFQSPNMLASYIVPIIMLLLGWVIWEKKIKNKFLLGAVSFICFIALFLTKSYGGFFGFGLGLIFLIFLSIHQKKKWFYLGAALLILLGVLISQIPTKKFQMLFETKKHTPLATRLQIWQASYLMIKDKPILGVGLSGFQRAYKKYIPKVAFPPFEWAVPQPHNLYLAFWLNMGLLGLISFLWVVILFFKLAIRDLRLAISDQKLFTNHYSLITSLMAAMIAILANGLVDAPYWKNDLSALFWIIVGLMTVVSKSHESITERYESPTK